MPHQHQTLSKQTQPSAQQAPTAMQVLTAREMREVAGGPVIDNGGIAILSAPPSGNNG